MVLEIWMAQRDAEEQSGIPFMAADEEPGPGFSPDQVPDPVSKWK